MPVNMHPDPACGYEIRHFNGNPTGRWPKIPIRWLKIHPESDKVCVTFSFMVEIQLQIRVFPFWGGRCGGAPNSLRAGAPTPDKDGFLKNACKKRKNWVVLGWGSCWGSPGSTNEAD